MKDEISSYGWITSALLVLAIIIALAFPFAKEIGISIKKNVTTIGDDAAIILENIKDEDFFGKVEGYTYYTQENIIMLGDRAVTVGYKSPIYIVGLYSDDLTEVVLTRNGDGSDGIMKAEAFMNNATLTSAILRSGVRNVSNRAFKNCINLSDVYLAESVTYIGYSAFESTPISSISLPKKVATIEGRAFANCDNLTTVYIPKSVTSIGSGAFADCENLKTIKFESKQRPEGFYESEYPGVTITYNN